MACNSNAAADIASWLLKNSPHQTVSLRMISHKRRLVAKIA